MENYTKILLITFLIHFRFVSYGQNLVPNPSFEDTLSCPIAVNQVNNSAGWSAYRLSPDYFNSCDTGVVDVPFNWAGYQIPHNGDAYAGFGLYYAQSSNWRECIGVQLNQTLTIGQQYFVSFYVSRAVNQIQSINISINKIGVRFSTVPYWFGNPVPIDNHSQVYTDSVISDTLNWVKIFGSFISDSTYNYISIGCFFNDSLVSVINNDSSAIAYYYVDDLCVSLSPESCEAVNTDNFALSNPAVNIFPNPARDWIEVWGNDIRSLVIYDILGRVIYKSNSECIPPIKLNISSFSRGTYLLQAKTRSSSIIQKLILQ